MALVVSLCFLLLMTRTWAVGTCNVPVAGPIAIPIQNVSVESSVIRRGAALSIGTPAQDFAFQIEPRANNTFIYDQSGQCSADTAAIRCLVSRGGAFDESDSSTWAIAADGVPETFNTTMDIIGHDTIHFNSTISIAGFPIHVPRISNFDMNALGFGLDSTILNGLRNAGTIASKSYSIWHGLTGAEKEHQMDGQVIIGGYDSAKISGSNYTAKLSPDSICNTGILATVTDISMNLPDGATKSIIGAGLTLQMCIEPSYELITIPESIWNTFQANAGGTNIGRATGINVWGELYEAQNVYAGGLTFTFSSGLEINIPNHQLVVPDIEIDSSGDTVFNDTTREIMLNSLQAINANDLPLLGMTFLTSAYLFVNQDENTFTLWQANPTTDEKLVAVGSSTGGCEEPAAEPINSNSTNSGIPSPASNATSSSTSLASSVTAVPTSKDRLSKGAIAGIVIASSIVATGIILGAIALLMRQSRLHNTFSRTRDDDDDGRLLRSNAQTPAVLHHHHPVDMVNDLHLRDDGVKYLSSGSSFDERYPATIILNNDKTSECYEMWARPTPSKAPRTPRFEMG